VAYTGGVGTYLKAADITENLAAAFMALPGADLAVYFKAADNAIISLAMSAGNVPESSIALDTDGTPKDYNLKRSGLMAFYIALFMDKTGKANSVDSSNLSSSYSLDKYGALLKEFRDEEARCSAKVTASTIMQSVTNSDSLIRSFEMRRG